MDKKIIVAHPEKQHSYRMTTATYKNGQLFRYITTVYYKRNNWTCLLDKITKGRLMLSKKRKNNDVPDEFVTQYLELRGILLLVLRRYVPNVIVNVIQNINFDCFGRHVAKFSLKNNVDAVIMYDTNSLMCFQLLRNSKIVKIMDTSIANRAYTKFIYEQHIKDASEWSHFSESSVLLSNREMHRLLKEIEETDCFIVPSRFVKKSLMFSGVKEKNIYIVPYGVDAELFEFSNRRNNIEEGCLELLFVGECSYRKGINYLLEAVAKLEGKVNLTIIGGYQRILNLYKKYKDCDNINFLGRINHTNLPSYYSKADVFILPSLSEGLSLVGLEAMACGLPLLCSENCGVNDLVIEGVNGWILDEISTDSIFAKLLYVLANRKNINQMGINARHVAEKNNWERYTKKMQKTLNRILDAYNKMDE